MKFPIVKLLPIVRANRANHRQIFLDAQDGYRKKVIEALERNLLDAKGGKEIRTYVSLTPPVDQTSDYDRIIKMLELSTELDVELDEKQFSNYVMDEWSWTPAFLATNSAYTSTARR